MPVSDYAPQTIYAAVVAAADNATGWEESDDPIYPERQTAAALEKSFVVRMSGERPAAGFMEIHGAFSVDWFIEIEMFRRKITNLTTLKSELWTAENAIKTAVYAALGPGVSGVQVPIRWLNCTNPDVRNADWYSQLQRWIIQSERTTA